jgi:hypothetical protein
MADDSVTITDADLELLLAETDRDDPFLRTPPREDDGETLDSQSLAGLVSP